jgi:hypothetical protein
MKIVALWNYEDSPESFNQQVGEVKVVFDTGKTSGGFISRYAEEEISKRATEGSVLWIASSWHPDELEGTLADAINAGCEVNLLLNSPYEFEGVNKVQFNATKILSKYHFRLALQGYNYNDYLSKGRQIHARFIVLQTGSNYWWLIGTSNHTRFGSMAKTSELAFAGENSVLGEQLINLAQNAEKFLS